MPHETTENLVDNHADSRQQQRHDERPDDRKAEKLLQEIAAETGQPAHSPVSLPDMGSVPQEQVQLLPAHQMIRVRELEEEETSQERQNRANGAGIQSVCLLDHTANMRLFSHFSKEKGRLRQAALSVHTIYFTNY